MAAGLACYRKNKVSQWVTSFRVSHHDTSFINYLDPALM